MASLVLFEDNENDTQQLNHLSMPNLENQINLILN